MNYNGYGTISKNASAIVDGEQSAAPRSGQSRFMDRRNKQADHHAQLRNIFMSKDVSQDSFNPYE